MAWENGMESSPEERLKPLRKIPFRKGYGRMKIREDVELIGLVVLVVVLGVIAWAILIGV